MTGKTLQYCQRVNSCLMPNILIYKLFIFLFHIFTVNFYIFVLYFVILIVRFILAIIIKLLTASKRIMPNAYGHIQFLLKNKCNKSA